MVASCFTRNVLKLTSLNHGVDDERSAVWYHSENSDYDHRSPVRGAVHIPPRFRSIQRALHQQETGGARSDKHVRSLGVCGGVNPADRWSIPRERGTAAAVDLPRCRQCLCGPARLPGAHHHQVHPRPVRIRVQPAGRCRHQCRPAQLRGAGGTQPVPPAGQVPRRQDVAGHQPNPSTLLHRPRGGPREDASLRGRHQPSSQP